MRFATMALLLLLPCFSGGCSVSTLTRGGALDLKPADQAATVSQSFTQGFITQGKAGEYDLVMVDSATQWEYKKTGKNKPIQPTPLAPIRQVLHIHMHWRPLAGTTRNPAAINASINWYVLGPDGSDDMLVYEGAGYVALRGSPDKRTLIIRDGNLKLKTNRGGLHDPIGSASISGRFVAATNDTRVQETLEDLEKQNKP